MGTTCGPTHRNEVKPLRGKASIRQGKSWIQVESPSEMGVSQSQTYPSNKFPGTNLSTCVERGTVRLKCAG